MLNYRFKALPELGWAVLIAVSLVVLPALVTLDPSAVTDWRVWLVALGGASVRAAAGAALDWFRRSEMDRISAPEKILAEIDALSEPEREALAILMEHRADADAGVEPEPRTRRPRGG